MLNQKYDGSYEIVVVDAGSTDGTPEMIEADFPKIKLLKRGHIGIGEAINAGILVAQGEILAFDVNNDECFPSGWLQTIVDGLLDNSNAGVVGGVRVLYGTDDTVDEAGIIYDYFGIPSSFIRARLADVPKVPIPVDYVGLPVFHRKILKKTGLIDEVYVLYSEDSDFCAQVKAAGYDVLVIPQAVSFHRRNTTIGKLSSLSVYYERRNHIRFVIKNFPFLRMIFSLMWTVVILTCIEALMFTPFMKKILGSRKTRLSFLSRNSTKENFRAVLEAIGWNFKTLRFTFSERSRIRIKT